jgi:hypothetical protein
LAGTAGTGGSGGKRFVGGTTGQSGKIRDERDLAKRFDLGTDGWASEGESVSNVSQPSWANVASSILEGDENITTVDESVMNEDLERLLDRLLKQMKLAATRLEFEKAAQLRDRIFQLENEG